MTRMLTLLAGTALAAGLGLVPASAQTMSEEAANRPANATDQEPAFENQTRAPAPAEFTGVAVATVAEDLPKLWAMEPLPGGGMLVTTKEGAMHVISSEGEVGAELEGVPEVASSGQGGLLDVALANDFESSRQIFFSFSEPREGGNGTSVASATLGETGLDDVSVIFQQMPTYDGNKHFGSRIVPTPDGNLFVTVGERSDTPIRDQTQDVGSGLGKVFHITATGEPAEGNTLAQAQNGALPEIWSYGHRNLQSAALDGQGRLWTVEHGPKGGDELNRPEAGKNYGWPIITYGLDYSGEPIGEGVTEAEGMEQPAYFWDPVIGPSGMAFYEGDEFPNWQGAALIGGLVTQDLVVLKIDGDRVASEERVPLNARIRDVKLGADGAIYAMTESRSGGSTILRLTASD